MWVCAVFVDPIFAGCCAWIWVPARMALIGGTEQRRVVYRERGGQVKKDRGRERERDSKDLPCDRFRCSRRRARQNRLSPDAAGLCSSPDHLVESQIEGAVLDSSHSRLAKQLHGKNSGQSTDEELSSTRVFRS